MSPTGRPDRSFDDAGVATSRGFVRPSLVPSVTSNKAMLELIELYLDDLSDRVDQIEQAMDADDRVALRALAGQLRRNADDYGLTPVTQSAAAVEQHADGFANARQLQESISQLAGLCHQPGEDRFSVLGDRQTTLDEW